MPYIPLLVPLKIHVIRVHVFLYNYTIHLILYLIQCHMLCTIKFCAMYLKLLIRKDFDYIRMA